jgi:hypothetical protein
MKWIFGTSLLALTLGWAATATIPAATITPDESLLKYFPRETEGIAFVDVAALKDVQLVKDALNKRQLRPLPDGINEFMKQTGFDPWRDVNRAMIGKIGPVDRLVVAEAHFDELKAAEFLREKGKQPEVYLGRAIYVDANTAASFINNIILVGSENAVKTAIDRTTYPGAVQIDSGLLEAIRTIEAGNQVWAVGSFLKIDLPVAGLRETPAAELLKSLRRGTYQMKIDRDLHARAMADFADPNTANNLADMARGFIAIAKLQVAKQQPDLLHVLDGIQVSSSGSSVVAQIEEPGDLLMKLPLPSERRK